MIVHTTPLGGTKVLPQPISQKEKDLLAISAIQNAEGKKKKGLINEFICAKYPLIKYCLRKTFTYITDRTIPSIEDLEQESVFVLLHCLERFDPSDNTSFNSYLTTAITRKAVEIINRENKLKKRKEPILDHPIDPLGAEHHKIVDENDVIAYLLKMAKNSGLAPNEEKFFRFRFGEAKLTAQEIVDTYGYTRSLVFAALKLANEKIRMTIMSTHQAREQAKSLPLPLLGNDQIP